MKYSIIHLEIIVCIHDIKRYFFTWSNHAKHFLKNIIACNKSDIQNNKMTKHENETLESMLNLHTRIMVTSS